MSEWTHNAEPWEEVGRGKGQGREGTWCSSQESKSKEVAVNQNVWIIQGRISGGRAVQTLHWRVWNRGLGMPAINETGKD